MINTCRSCLHLFNKDYVLEAAGKIVFMEHDPSGAMEASFASTVPCIRINGSRNSPLIWALAQGSCADYAFISFHNDETHLHVVELKSTVKSGNWPHILDQFKGMFLTSLAVARLLNIHRPTCVTCYIAMKKDRITNTDPSLTASPTLLKFPVGGTETYGGLESWNREVVQLPLSFEAALVKGIDVTGAIDFGAI